MRQLISIISTPEYSPIALKLQKKGDLVVISGDPFSSYYTDENNGHYFLNWVDTDQKCGRWLLIRLYEDQLSSFLKGEMSLLEIVLSNQMVAFIDFDEDSDIKCYHMIAMHNIPEPYLPKSDSKYDSKYYTEFAKELKKSICKHPLSLHEFIINHIVMLKQFFPSLDPMYEIRDNVYLIQVPDETNNDERFEHICGIMIIQMMNYFPDHNVCFITSKSLNQLTDPKRLLPEYYTKS